MLDVFRRELRQFSSKPLWQRRAVFGVVGALAGFAYYFFIGCASGACPISSNPYISTAYGAFIGILIPTKTRKPSEV